MCCSTLVEYGLKSDISDGSSFKVDAHVVEGTLHTLSTRGDLQQETETFVSDRLSYRSYLRLSHVNEIIVPLPIVKCTVSDYR